MGDCAHLVLIGDVYRFACILSVTTFQHKTLWLRVMAYTLHHMCGYIDNFICKLHRVLHAYQLYKGRRVSALTLTVIALLEYFNNCEDVKRM